MTTTIGNRPEARSKPNKLEALAFYHGAHAIDPAPVVAEIDARFNREASEQKEEPLRVLHALESKLQQVRKERPEAEAVWQRIRKELGDTPPPYFHVVLFAVFAVFALVLDTLFLAPTMDLLNIANPALQYLAAAGIAALSTALFEHCLRRYMNARSAAEKRNAMIVAGLGTFALIVWGLLRGHEIRFAASLAGNPLGDFVGAHPFLASVFFTFITIANPLIGAISLVHGWREFSLARTWRRARRRFEMLRSAEVDLARKVQAQVESLKEFDKRKQEECREWKSIFAYYYERGMRNGARREPLQSVIVKSVVGAMVTAPLALLVGAAWLPALIVAPPLAGFAFFRYFNHKRHHPSHEQFLSQENTKFAVIPDAPARDEIPRPKPRLLSKGDPS